MQARVAVGWPVTGRPAAVLLPFSACTTHLYHRGRHPQAACVGSLLARASPSTHAQAALLDGGAPARPQPADNGGLLGAAAGSYDEEMFEPSTDLRELASAQLRQLFAVLRRLSGLPDDAAAGARACVYARRADSLGSPAIQLQRVACWPRAAAARPRDGPAAASSDGLDELLTLQRPGWVPGGAGGGGGSDDNMPGYDTEASLCSEELLLLPNSQLLVLPLAEAGVLVGLLVVEVPGGVEPAALGASAAAAAAAASAGGGRSSAAGPTGSAAGPGVAGRALSEDALWCLRGAVPPLAKACAMDLRTALAGAQQEAQQRLARSLLDEARGPLKVLGTFGQLLAPRLRHELPDAPESDMADGIVLQGRRLAEVVAQLEAALRPSTALAGRRAAVGERASSGMLLRSSVGGSTPLALPPGVGDTNAAGASQGAFVHAEGGDYDDDEEEEAWQAWASADGGSSSSSSSNAAALLPAPGTASVRDTLDNNTASSSSIDSNLSGGGAAQQQSVTWLPPSQQQQQQDVLLPGSVTAQSLEAGRRSIRWADVEPARHGAAGGAASGAVMARKQQPPQIRVTAAADAAAGGYSSLAGVQLDVQHNTIDLDPVQQELDEVQQGSLDTAAAAAAAVESPGGDVDGERARRKQAGHERAARARAELSAAQAGGCCDAVATLASLLTTAAALAQTSGVNLVVAHPLQLDGPALGSSSDVGPTPGDEEGDGGGGVALLPRPVRPLLVGIAAGALCRIVGQVVDVALQCTPRGGQLCVTAAQRSGSVEISVLHTGHTQPERLHAATRALAGSRPMAAAAAAAAVGVAAEPMQNGAAASLSSARALRGSSGAALVSLEFAGAALSALGGRLSIVQSCQLMNALTGELELGSSISMWLPQPPAAAV